MGTRVCEVRRNADGSEYLVPLQPVPAEPRRPLTPAQQEVLKKLLLLSMENEA